MNGRIGRLRPSSVPHCRSHIHQRLGCRSLRLVNSLLIALLGQSAVVGFNIKSRRAFPEICFSSLLQYTPRFSQLLQVSKDSPGSEEDTQHGSQEKRQNLGNDIQKKFSLSQKYSTSKSISSEAEESDKDNVERVEAYKKGPDVSSLNVVFNKRQTFRNKGGNRSWNDSTGTQKKELKKTSKHAFDQNIQNSKKRKGVSASLLPPINDVDRKVGSDGRSEPDLLVNGLSSWEEFLASTRSEDNIPDSVLTKNPSNRESDSPVKPSVSDSLFADGTSQRDLNSYSETNPQEHEPSAEKAEPEQNYLPSIQDLFPMDLSIVKGENQDTTTTRKMRDSNIISKGSFNEGCMIPNNTSPTKADDRMSAARILQGISPVADLFYRSSQAQNQEDDRDDDDHDDEELPFSAEQTDSVTSDHNKIRIRRNMVQTSQAARVIGKEANPDGQIQRPGSNGTAPLSRGRKMVRRGMEMLVGGVPINADPPSRLLELYYDAQLYFDGDRSYTDWASTISLTTRDFGPLLHVGSIPKISLFEKALFCEHFCHYTIKWNVCPNDLGAIVDAHEADAAGANVNRLWSPKGTSTTSMEATFSLLKSDSSEKVQRSEPRTKVKGFRKESFTKKKSSVSEDLDDNLFNTKGTFLFEIAISKEELESGEEGRNGGILKAVFAKAFLSVLERSVLSAKREVSERFTVEIPSLVLTETDYGITSIAVEFKVEASYGSNAVDLERRLKRIGSIFTQAIDDGEIALAIASAAKDEKRWPESVRERVAEECLFQDDDSDDLLSETYGTSTTRMTSQNKFDHVKTLVELETVNENSDLFLGGGDDGIFFDYSHKNAVNSPYGGKLGPRLVESVVERARQRQPRVIAVGDVHGCVDELQDLLRQCDYSPGDVVVFLGDLVCKGPDSVAVVQMAREIGAIGVRGNHDFEVIRWHQAIKSGVDPPVVGSEHFHIASCLNKADMKWMYSLPWYISSKDLGCLFVHAGFVSGIRLAKQNPRLMMNMRSILPDGTVTSKFFNNWPWARLWDGPQTVLFGHDADRGLQQYEHALGLDTGCVYGGRLTACILPEKRLVSVSARKEYFKYRRKHYD